MKIIIYILIVLAEITLVNAQEIINEKFINDPDNYPNSPVKINLLNDSSYVVIGDRPKVSQSIIYKLDKNYEPLWSYNFQSSKVMDNTFFLANPIIQQRDNKFIYTAFWTGSIDFDWGYYYTFSLTAGGKLISNYIKNDSAGLLYGDTRFVPVEDSKYYAIGMDEFFKKYSIFIRKIDDYGNELWLKYYTDTIAAQLRPAKVFVNKQSNCTIFSNRSELNKPQSLLMLNCDKDGNEIFRKVIDISFYSLQDIFPTDDEGYLILSVQKDSIGNYHSNLVKTDDKGKIIWEKKYSFKDFTIFRSIAQIDNRYYLAGDIGDWDKFKATEDTATVKSILVSIDLNGSILWQKVWDLKYMNFIQSIIVNPRKNIVALGLNQGAIFVSEIKDNYTGINDKEKAETLLEISPNPATDFITIALKPSEGFEPSEGSEINIFNTLGEKVMSELIHPMTASHRMNIESLPKGIYFVKAGCEIVKFVKM
jgi:hypothetical protein